MDNQALLQKKAQVITYQAHQRISLHTEALLIEYQQY